MRVLILGYGGVGSVLTKLLLNENVSIICGDIRFFKKMKHRKVSFVKMNLLDEKEFIRHLKRIKPDVVVNTSLPKFNLKIMDACLKAGTNYMDSAAFWDLDPNPRAKIPYKMEQFEYAKDFEKKKLVGLIESGVAPGLTNLLSAECASKLDSVDYLKIRMVEDTGSSEVYFSWNKEWLLDELNSRPIIYEKGKFKFVESFGGEEEYRFPILGKRKTHYFAQDEVGSIPLYVKTKKLDVKICDNNIGASKTFVALGMTSEKAIEIKGTSIKPIEFISKILPDTKPGDEKRFPDAVFAISIEAIGKKNGKKKSVKYSVIFPNQMKISKKGLGNFISYPTALSIKLFLMSIPKIKKRGVFPPEAIEKEVRKDILKKLAKYPLKIVKNF